MTSFLDEVESVYHAGCPLETPEEQIGMFGFPAASCGVITVLRRIPGDRVSWRERQVNRLSSDESQLDIILRDQQPPNPISREEAEAALQEKQRAKGAWRTALQRKAEAGPPMQPPSSASSTKTSRPDGRTPGGKVLTLKAERKRVDRARSKVAGGDFGITSRTVDHLNAASSGTTDDHKRHKKTHRDPRAPSPLIARWLTDGDHDDSPESCAGAASLLAELLDANP